MEGPWIMAIDPSQFHLHNVTDTCAVWNVLSSRILYSRARDAGCEFCITRFVLYECLHKPRRNESQVERRLQQRLQQERGLGRFQDYALEISDLQDVHIMEKRQRLSKGELVSIAFAKKTRQAFLTDDQKARKLGRDELPPNMVQTTPHLLGWLFFTSRLSDGEKSVILEEHKSFGRPLATHFDQMYQLALHYRLIGASMR
jgi:hypothetical protein